MSRITCNLLILLITLNRPFVLSLTKGFFKDGLSSLHGRRINGISDCNILRSLSSESLTNDDVRINDSVHGDNNDLCQCLLERFQGDFDNYNQVVEDRKRGLLPREGGGHEHIHCTLVPLSKKHERLAAFYFDGIPERIFRFRHYEIVPMNEAAVDMKLSTLHPDLEKKLRAHHDPLEWVKIFEQFTVDESNKTNFLEGCDVRWGWEMDPEQHAYAMEHQATYKQEVDEQVGVHAVMVFGQAIVDSTIIPGTSIRILDQLSLWKDDFLIHDRGFDPVTGDFIYGNQRGIPYHLQRVSNVKASCDDVNGNTQDQQQRVVVNSSLQWTMGPSWRTREEYDKKMSVIGDLTSRLNTQPGGIAKIK